MKQSLPAIKFIGYLPTSLLSPDIVLKHLAGVPVGIFADITPVEHYGNASCEALSEYDNGSHIEKATLQFTTTDEIPENQEIAFVLSDVSGKSYVIGARESPFPMIEIESKVDEKTNIKAVKVVFTAKKALIPCAY